MNKEPQSFQTLDYPAMIDEAMRGVVRRTLLQVAEHGLPGKHHLYITFKTHFPGAHISPRLRERFPEDMTIVLQFQFWDLEVEEHRFSVMLSFNNIPERLVVPFAALTGFADPSIRFGLQFQSGAEAFAPLQETSFENPAVGEPVKEEPSSGGSSAEVISLDAFRKKQS